MPIDLDTLRSMLSEAEMMIPYYQRDVEKHATENAAMEAAGLKPLHNTFSVNHAVETLAKRQREAAALRAVITYHTGGIYRAEEAA